MNFLSFYATEYEFYSRLLTVLLGRLSAFGGFWVQTHMRWRRLQRGRR